VTSTSGVFHDLHERKTAVRDAHGRAGWTAAVRRSPKRVAFSVALAGLLLAIPVLAPRLTIPWVAGGPAPGTTLFGLVLLVGAIALLALAFPLVRGDTRAVPLIAGVAIGVAAFVAVATAALRGGASFLDYGAPSDVAVRMGPAPVICAWAAVLALASLRVGPTLAAMVVGGGTIVVAILLPTWPFGTPALLTPLVLGVLPWLVLGALAVWMRLRPRPTRGADAVALGLLLLGPILPFAPFPQVVSEVVSAAPRRDLVSGDDVLFLVAAGCAWLAAGLLFGVRRRPGTGQTRASDWAAVRAAVAVFVVGITLVAAEAIFVSSALQMANPLRQPPPLRLSAFLDHTLGVESRIDRSVDDLHSDDLREVRSGGSEMRTAAGQELGWLSTAEAHACYVPYRDAYRAWVERVRGVAAQAVNVRDEAGRAAVAAAWRDVAGTWRFPLEETRLACRLAR
jgi:hypothetical protein